jgi:hypothetical protein
VRAKCREAKLNERIEARRDDAQRKRRDVIEERRMMFKEVDVRPLA